MERLINNRLLDYLERVPNFCNIQCGGLKGRSTTDHLIQLESDLQGFCQIRTSNRNIYNFEKVYDLTWKYGIMLDLHRLGLRGRLPMYIQQFLCYRKFAVRAGNSLSSEYLQENGIPQGSVLSVTLFIIKIDEMSRVIPSSIRSKASLYMDDLQVSCFHSDLNEIQAYLQQTMTAVSDWTLRTGFKISSKTKADHFRLHQLIAPSPTGKINGNNVEYRESLKFFGNYIWQQIDFSRTPERPEGEMSKSHGTAEIADVYRGGSRPAYDHAFVQIIH